MTFELNSTTLIEQFLLILNEKNYFKTLEENFPICIRHWTPCKPRFTILLFDGHCDFLWCNPLWM